jgi:tetratricopeptide (TPR) repeat protein
MRIKVALVALALAGLSFTSAAQQLDSMTADEAYVRAAQLMQQKLNQLETRLATQSAEIAALKAVSALKAVRDDAKAGNEAAQTALTALAQGQNEKGVDALLADAASNTKQAVEKFRRAGQLAFAVDTRKALAAYQEVLKLAPEDLDARNETGTLKLRLGDLAGAEGAYRAVLNSAGRNEGAQAAALGNLGNIAYTRGDLAAAEDYQKRSLALNTKLGEREGLTDNLSNLGAVAYARGKLAAAEDYQTRALALNIELGRKAGQAINLSNLASIRHERGNLAAAEDYEKRALALEIEIGAKQGQAISLSNLGTTAYSRGDLAAAEDYQKRALALNNELGIKAGQADCLSALGDIALDRGDLAVAEDYQKRALALNIELGLKNTQANNLNNLGAIAWQRGSREEACGFFGRALALYDGVDAGAAQYARAARTNLDQFCPRLPLPAGWIAAAIGLLTIVVFFLLRFMLRPRKSMQ